MVNNFDFKGTIIIRNRELLEIDGINSIAAFDEGFVALNTESGIITVDGEEMKIENISKEKGTAIIVGKINSVSFDAERKKRGILGVFS